MAKDFINSDLVKNIVDEQGLELSSLFELSIIKHECVEVNRECEIIQSIIWHKSISNQIAVKNGNGEAKNVHTDPNNEHSEKQRLPKVVLGKFSSLL
jgi:hypothetical protein